MKYNYLVYFRIWSKTWPNLRSIWLPPSGGVHLAEVKIVHFKCSIGISFLYVVQKGGPQYSPAIVVYTVHSIVMVRVRVTIFYLFGRAFRTYGYTKYYNIFYQTFTMVCLSWMNAISIVIYSRWILLGHLFEP